MSHKDNEQPNKQQSDQQSAGAMTVSPRLLELLVCPVSRGPLTYDREKNELVSPKAKLAFPIRDGIPIMLEAEARRLD